MGAVLVKNADRMMLTAAPLEGGIELTFADGCIGLIPFCDLPEIVSGGGVSGLELPNPYEIVVVMTGGGSTEIPWDFARHYCDRSYRPRVEAIARQGRQSLGQAHPGTQGGRRIDPGGVGRTFGDRAGHAGSNRKGGAESQIQHTLGCSGRAGLGCRGPARLIHYQHRYDLRRNGQPSHGARHGSPDGRRHTLTYLN